MALTTITGNMVSVNAIQGTLIADNAITAVHIASNAVTSIHIAENNVTAREIASNSITVAQLADASVESDKIANGVITTNHLNSAMISSQTEVTAVAGDFVLLGDTSDSNNLKKTPVSSIVALAGVADGAITSAKLDTNIAIAGTLGVTGDITGTLATAAQPNITSVGTLSALTVDDITINGSTISDAGELTIDAGGDIILEAAGNQIAFKGSAGQVGFLDLATSRMDFKVSIADAEMRFQGNDGGVAINALTLDMSAAGAATFNAGMTVGGNLTIQKDDALIFMKETDGTNIAAVGDITGEGVGGCFLYNHGGTATTQLRADSASTIGHGLTITGKLIMGTGASAAATINAYSTTVATNLPSALRVIENTGASNYWDIGSTGGASNILNFYSNANVTPKVSITGAGNVGIGTGSPATKLHVNGESRFEDYLYGSTANNKLYINEDVAIVAGKKLYLDGGSNTYIHEASADEMAFIADGNEVMRCVYTGSAGGTLRIGTTSVLASSAEKMAIQGTAGLTIKTTSYANYQPLILWNNASTADSSSTLVYIAFLGLGGTLVGSISSVGSTTSYNTSSDYRLKENVDYTWDATTRLKQLKPARFNWIEDETNTLVDGFLAHEVSSIVPEAITGVKDETETNENCILNAAGVQEVKGVTEAEWIAGKIPLLWTEDDELPEGVSVGDVKEKADYASDTTWVASHTQDVNQSIDQSKLVPLLVKTIQELEARITTLENA